MLITCKCLNVSIQLGKSKPKGIHQSSLNLTTLEKSAKFFAEGVAVVEDVQINKQLASLVVSQMVGSWIIETCINCSLSYYGQHKDKKIPPLISAGLISDPNTLQMLKSHTDFSPVFRIVIAPQHDAMSSFLSKEAAQTVQTALSGLQQQLSDAVQKQGAKTDENIRIYSEQQFEFLEKFRERATRDHKALIRLIYKTTPTDESKSNVMIESRSTPPMSPTKAIPTSALDDLMTATTSRPISAAVSTPRRRTAGRSNSLFSPCRGVAESLDAEGVFNLEGMEDSPPELGVSEGESDTDHDDSGSHDEGIDLRRKKGNIMNLARSLPVNVPVFAPGDYRMTPIDIDGDSMAPQDPHDIAASIKALARSVHGDTVFGDLPRPRFSTQI